MITLLSLVGHMQSLGGGSRRPGSGGLSRMTAMQMKEASKSSSGSRIGSRGLADGSSAVGLGTLLDRRGSGEVGGSMERPSAAAVVVDLDAYQRKMQAVLDRASHACEFEEGGGLSAGDYVGDESDVLASGIEVIPYDRYGYSVGEDGSALEGSDDDEDEDSDEDVRRMRRIQRRHQEATSASAYEQQLMTRYGYSSSDTATGGGGEVEEGGGEEEVKVKKSQLQQPQQQPQQQARKKF
jgi:hypothetical protein